MTNHLIHLCWCALVPPLMKVPRSRVADMVGGSIDHDIIMSTQRMRWFMISPSGMNRVCLLENRKTKFKNHLLFTWKGYFYLLLIFQHSPCFPFDLLSSKLHHFPEGRWSSNQKLTKMDIHCFFLTVLSLIS